MFTIRDVQLETVCGITSTLPDNDLPEIAFAGKSNVGKSSLLNGLVNRKSLARTSAQPGKTRTINYYHVNGFEKRMQVLTDAGDEAGSEAQNEAVNEAGHETRKKAEDRSGSAKSSGAAKEIRTDRSLYLVDLPGYGYAKASEEIKAQWGKLIEKYLKQSKQLRQVFLLVDIRHEPGANDRQMYEWICYNGYEPVIIATKLDKLKRSQVAKQTGLIRKGLGMKPGGVLIPFSAETKQGRDEIWEQILQA